MQPFNMILYIPEVRNQQSGASQYVEKVPEKTAVVEHSFLLAGHLYHGVSNID